MGMAAVSRAASFAFAGVLPFAAVVTGFATAFAFTGVLSFAGMNVLLAFVGHLLERNSGLTRRVSGVRLDGERTTHQAGNCCAREDGCWFHVFVWFGFLPGGGISSKTIEAVPSKERGRTRLRVCR